MRALSVRQPWADLFFTPPLREISERELGAATDSRVRIAQKCIEIRCWRLFPVGQVQIGETIAIHAGRRPDPDAPARISFSGNCRLGGVIGTAVFRGFKAYSDPAQFNADRPFHQWSGRDELWFKEQQVADRQVLGLVLTDPKLVSFIGCPGQLGFFEVAGPPADMGEGRGF